MVEVLIGNFIGCLFSIGRVWSGKELTGSWFKQVERKRGIREIPPNYNQQDLVTNLT